MLTKDSIVLLLGRPLTPTEVSNFDPYLDNATEQLSQILGFSFDTTAGTRTFRSREGYRTVFVDPFTAITSVTVNGFDRVDYVKKQNDSYNGSWFNGLEFDDRLCGERIEITATWGFGVDSDSKPILPTDLALVLAGLFTIHDTAPNMVKMKKNEGFWITYKDDTKLQTFVTEHLGTIRKYGQLDGEVDSGRNHDSYWPMYGPFYGRF